jgi:hypothetical protein
MPKTITKATLTLNPLKLVIEQIESPSSTFPAAPTAVDVDGATVTEVIRPLAKVVAPPTKLRRLA